MPGNRQHPPESRVVMSTTALAMFLEQQGVKPTGDRKKDMKLAKQFFVKFKIRKKG